MFKRSGANNNKHLSEPNAHSHKDINELEFLFLHLVQLSKFVDRNTNKEQDDDLKRKEKLTLLREAFRGPVTEGQHYRKIKVQNYSSRRNCSYNC